MMMLRGIFIAETIFNPNVTHGIAYGSFVLISGSNNLSANSEYALLS